MAYPLEQTANAILELAWDANDNISPMKLQKLVYLAHGLHLALFDRPLIDTTIEAWKYGPVVPPLYYELRHYGGSNIDIPVTLESYELFVGENTNTDVKLSRETQELLREVWDAYGHHSAVDLSNLTHDPDLPEGKPWHITWFQEGGNQKWGTDISDELIKQEFQRLVSSV